MTFTLLRAARRGRVLFGQLSTPATERCILGPKGSQGDGELSMSTAAAHGRDAPFRGFGATFNEAWDHMNPRRADQIPKSPSVGRTLRQELGAVSKVVQFEEWKKSLDQGNDPIGKD
jgi:hypothetical protein